MKKIAIFSTLFLLALFALTNTKKSLDIQLSTEEIEDIILSSYQNSLWYGRSSELLEDEIIADCYKVAEPTSQIHCAYYDVWISSGFEDIPKKEVIERMHKNVPEFQQLSTEELKQVIVSIYRKMRNHQQTMKMPSGDELIEGLEKRYLIEDDVEIDYAPYSRIKKRSNQQ